MFLGGRVNRDPIWFFVWDLFTPGPNWKVFLGKKKHVDDFGGNWVYRLDLCVAKSRSTSTSMNPVSSTNRWWNFIFFCCVLGILRNPSAPNTLFRSVFRYPFNPLQNHLQKGAVSIRGKWSNLTSMFFPNVCFNHQLLYFPEGLVAWGFLRVVTWKT